MNKDILPSRGCELLAGGSKCIEGLGSVEAFIERLNDLLSNGAKLFIQSGLVEEGSSSEGLRNKNSLNLIFPDENPITLLKREVRELKADCYICSLTYPSFPKRSKERVFGRVLRGKNIYIKIRFEPVEEDIANKGTIIISFLFSDNEFIEADFPYKLK